MCDIEITMFVVYIKNPPRKCQEFVFVLSDVSSLFTCRQEIYVCLRKQMIALIVR